MAFVLQFSRRASAFALVSQPRQKLALEMRLRNAPPLQAPTARPIPAPGASPQGKTAPEGASALPKAGVKAKPKRLNCLPPPRHNRHSTPPAQKGNPKSLVKPPNHLNPTKQREKSVHINTTRLSIIEIELKKRSRTNSGAPSIRSFIADGWIRRTHPTHSRDFEHKISGINILPRIIAANLTF